MSDASLAALQRINSACDRYHQTWEDGRRPRVAEFLHDAPEEDRPALRRELLREAVFYFRADQRRRWSEDERVAV